MSPVNTGIDHPVPELRDFMVEAGIFAVNPVNTERLATCVGRLDKTGATSHSFGFVMLGGFACDNIIRDIAAGVTEMATAP